MENLKHKIEAILFSAGKKVDIEEIAKLANTSTSMAQQAMNELKKDYSGRSSSLMLVDEGNAWKIIVKDEFTQIVKKIVTETELSKTIMETLAVIAFRYPIKQSDLIKIRTNKAYDHLRELEEMAYSDIAEVLHLSEGTVMSRLHRARIALVSNMKKLGLDKI